MKSKLLMVIVVLETADSKSVDLRDKQRLLPETHSAYRLITWIFKMLLKHIGECLLPRFTTERRIPIEHLI